MNAAIAAEPLETTWAVVSPWLAGADLLLAVMDSPQEQTMADNTPGIADTAMPAVELAKALMAIEDTEGREIAAWLCILTCAGAAAIGGSSPPAEGPLSDAFKPIWLVMPDHVRKILRRRFVQTVTKSDEPTAWGVLLDESGLGNLLRKLDDDS